MSYDISVLLSKIEGFKRDNPDIVVNKSNDEIVSIMLVQGELKQHDVSIWNRHKTLSLSSNQNASIAASKAKNSNIWAGNNSSTNSFNLDDVSFSAQQETSKRFKIPEYEKYSSFNARYLAKKIVQSIDENNSAIENEEFQSNLKELSRFTARGLLDFMEEVSKNGESLMEMIMDEFSDKDVEKKACKDIFGILIKKAKELHIDTSSFEEEFYYNLEFQYKSNMFIMDSKGVDKVVNALCSAIESKLNFKEEDIDKIQTTSSNQANEEIISGIEKRNQVASDNFNDYQDEKGWIGSIVDFMLYGSENSSSEIKADLNEAKKLIESLKAAKLQGPEVFKAKFKELFGVGYDYEKIVAYQKAEEMYSSVEIEEQFNNKFKDLLSDKPLVAETRTRRVGGKLTERMVVDVIKTKEQKYEEQYKSLANFLGVNGKQALDALLKEKNVENGSLDEKYAVLKELVKTQSNELDKYRKKLCKDKTSEEVKKFYNSSYNAAYGYKNDILKRVSDYTIVQRGGTDLTKMGIIIGGTILLTCATGGAGGAIGTGAIAGATNAAVEISDKATNNIDDLSREDVLEILKQSAITGAETAAGMKIGSMILATNMGNVTKFGATVASDISIGAAGEYARTGDVTLNGTLANIPFAVLGNLLAIRYSSPKNPNALVDDVYRIINKNNSAILVSQGADGAFYANGQKTSLEDFVQYFDNGPKATNIRSLKDTNNMELLKTGKKYITDEDVDFFDVFGDAKKYMLGDSDSLSGYKIRKLTKELTSAAEPAIERKAFLIDSKVYETKRLYVDDVHVNELMSEKYYFEIDDFGNKIRCYNVDGRFDLVSDNAKLDLYSPTGNVYDTNGHYSHIATEFNEKMVNAYSKDLNRSYYHDSAMVMNVWTRDYSELFAKYKDLDIAVDEYIKQYCKDIEVTPQIRDRIKTEFRASILHRANIDKQIEMTAGGILPHKYYRGISGNQNNFGTEVLAKAKVGDVIVPDYGNSYASRKLICEVNDLAQNGYLLEIKVPDGTKVSQYYSLWNQVLLPSGRKYKVTGVKDLGWTKKIKIKLLKE